MIQLPIPLEYKGNLYTQVEIGEITAGLLADTQKVVETGDTYKALASFCGGIITQVDDETDKANIRNMAVFLPYKAAEYIIIKGLLKNDKDDGVEGYYECPRCGAAKIAEYNQEEALDTRDHIQDLETAFTENNEYSWELKRPVIIKSGEAIIDEIQQFTFGYPTLAHCSAALNKVGMKDQVRLQLAILIESIKTVNGKLVERSWKTNYGQYVFDRMERADLIGINKAASSFGLNPVVKKQCLRCSKEFEVTLNTANFFVSALQS